MAVVKAHTAAEHLLRDYEFGQSDQDRHNGWRYFLEETDLVSGMSADEATKLRQARLERRESESWESLKSLAAAHPRRDESGVPDSVIVAMVRAS